MDSKRINSVRHSIQYRIWRLKITQRINSFVYYWNSTKKVTVFLRLLLASLLIMGREDYQIARLIKNFNIFEKQVFLKTEFGNFFVNTFSAISVLNKQYEPEIREVIMSNYNKNISKPEKIFIDIGSNIGRYAIELSKNYNYISYAFEPSPISFQRLKRNVELSNVESKVKIYNFGLGNKETSIKMYYDLVMCGNDTFVQSKALSSSIVETIPVKIFDNLDLSLNPKNVVLILIDVEGYELLVLQGMEHFLQQLDNIDIIVEIHDNSTHTKDICNYMKQFGFKQKQLDKMNWCFSKGVSSYG